VASFRPWDDRQIAVDRFCKLPGYTNAVGWPGKRTRGTVQNIQAVTQPLFKQFGLGKPLQATDGNLWTWAYIGGTSNYGRIFSITTSSILDSLSFNGTNGRNPVGALIQTSDGTLYGTAVKGSGIRRHLHRFRSLSPKR
jgi:hypothetical protein